VDAGGVAPNLKPTCWNDVFLKHRTKNVYLVADVTVAAIKHNPTFLRLQPDGIQKRST